jgi:hypothetical protein
MGKYLLKITIRKEVLCSKSNQLTIQKPSIPINAGCSSAAAHLSISNPTVNIKAPF